MMQKINGVVNPITDGIERHSHFTKTLEGQTHKIFRVHHFQWESMGNDNRTLKKKIPKLLPISCGSQ